MAQHGRFKVVVEQFQRHAAEVLEGMDMAGQEAHQVAAERELDVLIAAVAQNHREARQSLVDSIDLQKTEAGPVHLRLLARKSFKTRHRLPMLFNAQGRDEPFHQIIAPFVALGLDVLEQPLGREILGFELGLQIVRVWIQHGRRWLFILSECRSLKSAANGLSVDSHLSGDG